MIAFLLTTRLTFRLLVNLQRGERRAAKAGERRRARLPHDGQALVELVRLELRARRQGAHFLLPFSLHLSVGRTPQGIRVSRHEPGPSFYPVHPCIVSLCRPYLP